MHRSLLRLAFYSLVVLSAASASAAPRDAAANKKIDEAINTHYLTTDFDKAEAVLTGTINACGDKCSGPVIARAWMYVGIVRGSGKGDAAGAKDAFTKAVAADKGVKLDEALATDATKKAFAEAVAAGGGTPAGTGGGGGTEPPEPGGEEIAGGTPAGTGGGGGTEPPEPGGEEIAGEMECTPGQIDVETRRPIPVSCTTEEDAVKAELRYKEFGGEQWRTVKLAKKGDFFQGTIPCQATMLAGTLRFYVRATDAAGDVIDTFGTKSKPAELNIVGKTDAEPPAFPDKDPPARCEEQVECPPDFPGCKSGGGGKGWGASCAATSECEAGLACIEGSCESAKACDIDADCPSGSKCESGRCSAGGGPTGPWKKNWLGFHVAQDLAIVGGDDVCSQASQDNDGFACFYSGTEEQYRFDPQPGVANKISTGVAPATTRVMASFDRVLGENLTLGARVGFAFNGGPPAGPNGETKFLPIHGEARIGYWFGQSPFNRKGLRPYIHGGGGVAQVDAKLPVTVRDCANGDRNADRTSSFYTNCAAGLAGNDGQPLELDAYKKLGQSFVTVGGGAVYALSENSGLQLNLNLMFMLPTSGQVVEPSIGYVFGL